MLSAREWKTFYARERHDLGERGLSRLLDEGEAFAQPAAAMIFPHTRLATSGALAAAAALAAVRSGADEILAIGVLHGGRDEDAERVRLARSGDLAAREALRAVHGPGAPFDAGVAAEEFSLDGFTALVDVASRREGRRPPRIVARYPFFTGVAPESLRGWDELASALARGAALVATADPIHHGAGYETPPSDRLEGAAAIDFARKTVDDLVARLLSGDLAGHAREAERARSDFRDAGPVFAALAAARGATTATRRALRLVDYADALQAERPTWVAGALIAIDPPSRADHW